MGKASEQCHKLKLHNSQRRSIRENAVFLGMNTHKETRTHTPIALRATTATDFPLRFTIGQRNSCSSPQPIKQEQGSRTQHKYTPIKEPKINPSNQASPVFFSRYFLLTD